MTNPHQDSCGGVVVHRSPDHAPTELPIALASLSG